MANMFERAQQDEFVYGPDGLGEHADGETPRDAWADLRIPDMS